MTPTIEEFKKHIDKYRSVVLDADMDQSVAYDVLIKDYTALVEHGAELMVRRECKFERRRVDQDERIKELLGKLNGRMNDE